jgi:hypothetical protein
MMSYFELQSRRHPQSPFPHQTRQTFRVLRVALRPGHHRLSDALHSSAGRAGVCALRSEVQS